MQYKCSHTWENGNKDIWKASIDYFINYGDYCEISISSRSSINLLFGKYSHGLFACAPIYGGTFLSNRLDDIFYNTERLTKVFDNVVDGITAAKALSIVSSKVQF